MAKKFTAILIALLMVLVTVLFCAVTSGADDEASIDLTTLTLKSSKVGYGTLCINTGLDGGKIDMQNSEGGTTIYQKGFTAHASSELTFDISNLDVCMFTSYIGAEHSTTNQTTASTSIIFIVKADNKVLYTSPVLGYNDPALFIEVPIPAGTKILSLITDDAGSNAGDHSAWGEPRLSADPSSLNKLSSCTLSCDKDVYIVGEQFDLSYTFTSLSGNPLEPDTLKFSSDRPDVATVDKSGHVTAKGEGDAVITMSGDKDGIDFSESLIIAVLGERVTKEFNLSSPSGDITLAIRMTEEGKLCYTVTDKAGNIVAEDCYVGINTDKCNFSYALKYSTHTPVNEVKQSYTISSGKRSEVEDHYNEMTLTFKRNDTYYFDVYFRAYDEGFAYRFAIRRIDGKSEELLAITETGTYTVSANTKVYAEFISSIFGNFGYEQGYEGRMIEKLNNNVYAVMPVLFDLNCSGKFLFVSESDLYGDSYAGAATHYIGNNTFEMCWAPRKGNVTITTDFTSPWRFGVYGDLGDIVESDLTEKLATPANGDFSWVEAGVTAWTWLSEGYAGQSQEAIIKEYVDMAAEMGWKYMILDEGWNTSGRNPYCKYYKWFPDMVKYAASKGVSFIAWVYSPNIKDMDLGFLDDYAEVGIKGIKIDFFDSEDQYTIDLYHAVYEKCADLHLLVNCHGANKPTGERKTYPNVIAREAVIGEEYGSLIMSTALYWPYTRNVVGPIDITPRLYPTGSNSVVSQMAVNVVFECGFPCMASDANDYLGFSAKSFYQNLPAAWDDIHFIDGEVGTWTSIARRSGGIWYAASMTVASKNSVEMPLDFLDDGTYYALIYSENGQKDVTVSLQKVTNKDTLNYSMRNGGGYIAKFINEKDCANYLPSSIKTESQIKLIAGNTAKVEYSLVGENVQLSDVVFKSSDESVALVDAQGVVIGVKPGKTTVTISSYIDESISTTVEVVVEASPVLLNDRFISGPVVPIFDFENSSAINITPVEGGSVYKNVFKNELRYGVTGDFTATVKMNKFTVLSGYAGGFIFRSGSAYIAIERSNSGSATWVIRSSGKDNGTTIMTDYGGTMFISFEKSGNTVKVLCGSTSKNLVEKGSIVLNNVDASEMTVGIYALNTGSSKETVSFPFSNFTVNGEQIPFTVPNGGTVSTDVSVAPGEEYLSLLSGFADPALLTNPVYIVKLVESLITVK